ncbi:AraC family transcriptional regulator [Pseudoxanthomonas winnipegensis]|nr:AraC family transcriptional regulator [Pseudoxanthomonas winnipegensis]
MTSKIVLQGARGMRDGTMRPQVRTFHAVSCALFFRSSGSAMDPLSDILSLLRPRSFSNGGLDAGRDWAIAFPAHEGVKFNAVLKGKGWVRAEGETHWHEARSGDCVLFTHGRAFVAASDPALAPVAEDIVYRDAVDGVATCNGGGAFYLLGTRFTFEGDHRRLLFDALPSIMIVRGESSQAAVLHWTLRQLQEEMRNAAPASLLMREHLAQIMLLQMLRVWLATTAARGQHRGLLAGLADSRLAHALGAMHAEPARPWRIGDLAALANMSRTTFAARFHLTLGAPPLGYLTAWRMRLAADRLRRTDANIGHIGFAVGYSSEAAFSTAFKRVLGCSPAQYRRRVAPPA